MRDRRRHLVGISVARSCARRRARRCPGVRRARDGVPSLASPSQKPFVAPKPRPTEARRRPTDDPDPNRNAYSVPRGAELARLRAALLRPLGRPRASTPPSLTDATATASPTSSSRSCRSPNTCTRSRTTSSAGASRRATAHRGGGNGKTDVYLSQIGGELFGYAAPDRGQATKRHRIPRRLHGYLVLDNDYSPFEFPGTKPTDDLKVTLAHEYNHILQFGYDAYQDPWFAESSATWMEDQVYNGINDYLRYVRRWVSRCDTPLTTSSIKEYGSAVWNQWLARRYGPEIVRKAWAAGDPRPARRLLGRRLRIGDPRRRALDLGHDFARFAAAVAEWRTGEGFRESGRYPDMPRQGALPLGRPAADPPAQPHDLRSCCASTLAGGRAVAVRAMAPRGTAAGLALVGRLGSERRGRTVTRFDFSRGGGKLAVRLADPGRFSRITAVVVNADASANGFSARRLDWRYLTDRIPFEVGGRLIR